MAERGGGGSRGRGGKFSKPKRGGARHFSQRTNDDGEVVNMWSARGGRQPSDDDSSSEEEDSDDSSDEESSDSDGPSGPSAGPELTREQRKAEQKARKEAAIRKAKGTPQVGDMPSSDESDDEAAGGAMPANPNHTPKARSQAAAAKAPAPEPEAKDKGKAKDGAQLSRREREALAAQAAKERYQKLHAEGKTDEARADLARLKLIKEKREAEAERRKAEAEEKAAEAKARAESSGLTEREKKMREAALGKNAAGKKKK